MNVVDLEVIAHVQILGTVLNRCVSPGDRKWGQKWEFILLGMSILYISVNE